MSEEAKALVRRYFAAGLDHNWHAFDEIFAEDYVNHGPMGDQRGIEAMKGFAHAVMDLVPNPEIEIENIVAEDDTVALWLTLRGTFQGKWLGVDVTGKRGEVREFQFYRTSGGKIAERWFSYDGVSLAESLGLKVEASSAEAPRIE